jgi:hypothetical protein
LLHGPGIGECLQVPDVNDSTAYPHEVRCKTNGNADQNSEHQVFWRKTLRMIRRMLPAPEAFH